MATTKIKATGIADNAITASAIADTSITSAKLSGALTTPSSLTLGGDLNVNTHKVSGGDYSSLQPEQATASVSSTHNIDMNTPLHIITLSASTTFSFTNLAEGKITMIKMNAASGRTPSFGSNTKWPAATEPTWADHVYWLVSVIGHSGTITFASATGFTV